MGTHLKTMSSLELMLYTIASSLFLYFLYNLLFSRRAGRLPPGPRPWPVVGNLPHMGAAPHQSLAALAKVHGPLFHLRLGLVHVVVAASASVAAQFLKTHDAKFASRPPNSGAKHIAYNYKNMVFAPYGPRWRMLRKICQVHLFSAKALDDFGHVREEEVGILIGALARAGKNPAQLGNMLYMCTTNALGRVMLGRRVFGDGTGKSDAKADEFKNMVIELMVLSGEPNISDFIPLLDWFDLQGIASKMKKLHKRFDFFLEQILDEHKAMLQGQKPGQQHSDLLSLLISLKDKGDGEDGKLSDVEIKALLLDLFAAGTDTSSSTTEWALAELIRHPKVMARLQAELDSVIGRDRLVTEADLSGLTYFQAVMKEVFRLHPSTPLSLPRMATESCEINGYHIPKNATLLVNVWGIARDPEAWESPLEFRPSRFLAGGERPNADIRGNDFEVIPFGAGRRICAGMNLGLRMVQYMTATLVHGFEWELGEGEIPEELNMEEAFGLTLQRKVPLSVYPKPRLPSHAYKVYA